MRTHPVNVWVFESVRAQDAEEDVYGVAILRTEIGRTEQGASLGILSRGFESELFYNAVLVRGMV